MAALGSSRDGIPPAGGGRGSEQGEGESRCFLAAANIVVRAGFLYLFDVVLLERLVSRRDFCSGRVEGEPG